MEIEKAYFSLEEILERWTMREVDLRYLAENDQLRLSIRCFNLPIEFGDYEDADDGRHFSIPWEQGYYSGVLDLCVRDVFQLFRHGEVQAGYFRTTRAAYACLWGSREHLTIRKPDLVLRRDERDRFEAETGFSGAAAGPRPQGFEASPDYQEVRCNGCRFQLGQIQAQVVRLLHEAARRGEPRERGCAMVFQNYALYPHMSVAENIGYTLKVAGMKKAERMAKVQAVAVSVGLDELLDRRPGQLSGGQRQRVAMAGAIIREPKVFLFDEPLSNLDAKLRVQMS